MKDDTKSIRVLLIDSRTDVLEGLAKLINAEKPRLKVVSQATSYSMALDSAKRMCPDVVLFNFFTDPLDPMAVISALSRQAQAKVLVMKGLNADIPIASAIGAGARGVIRAEDPVESIPQIIAKVHLDSGLMNQVRAVDLENFAARRRFRANVDPDQAKLAQLTVRERELIRNIVANPSGKYIAIGAKLGISEHTVHNHLSSIYSKLGLINRADLVVYAMKHGSV
jgi:NarL family two-component system response regulator LiaR